MVKKRSQSHSFKSRLIGLFASLLFSVPTAAFVWLGINKQLAYFDAGFFSSFYLVVCILGFALIALLLPQFFPSILGRVWRAIVKVERWWGW